MFFNILNELLTKEDLAKFSFLMVIVPVLGENILELIKGKLFSEMHIGGIELIIGFLAAFISGVLACKWMITIVKKGKLIYFAIYCFIVGIIVISLGLFGS